MTGQARQPTAPSLTRAEIREIVGELDDAVITAILNTGATTAQVEEARIWALGDAADMGRQGLELGPAARAVYDILVTDPTFLGPEREP